MFELGILTGIILSVLVVLTLLYLKSPIERHIRQVESKYKQRGSIIEPDAEELNDVIQGAL